MIPLRSDQEFDVIILVTQVLAKPAGVSIPPRAVLRRFFIPLNKSSSSSSPFSGSTFDSFHQKFGCLESFKPNAKYTFLLADAGENILHRGIRLPVFALSGPSLSFSEKVTAEILQYLCKTCYSPQINTFEPQILPFGEDFNATCVVDGNPLPQVMWYKDNYPVDIATNGRNVRVEIVEVNNHVREAILEIDNLVLLDNGDYVCKAKNPLGTAQSLLELRVTTAGVSLADQEIAMESRDLEPCPVDENHCFNDGECFAKKSNPLDRRCKCKEGFMGDQCQFRTSGIVFSTMSTGNVNTLWLQIFFQFVFIAIFGLIVVGIILVFRRKDLRAKQKRNIMQGSEVLLKSQYIQVNTFEPPPPPINSPLSSNRQAHYQINFLTSAIPQTPHYARLVSNEFNFDAHGDLKNANSLEESSPLNHPRFTSLQQPQRVGLSRGALEPIEEQEMDASSNFLPSNRGTPNFLYYQFPQVEVERPLQRSTWVGHLGMWRLSV
ncbi:Obscurin [Taenia crassiceps]|uniref:Obscurin n=1 Tax=Taenia crassiceps TaxID=6207 RepID=A0ABR4QB25_9CEST